MAGDSTSMAETLRLLQEAQAGRAGGVATAAAGGFGPLAKAGAKADPKAIAFQAQLKMAQQMIASNQPENEPSSYGMDTGLLSDSFMMDTLKTIAQLTGQDLPTGKAQLAPTPAKALTRNPTAENLGAVAALFESGEKGVEAIGFDRTGGTSYGKFQLSSRAGTMNRFIAFLAEKEPAWADRLRKAGPANTGSIKGRMPAEWAKIAGEEPAKFERLQHEFIKKDHYQPAREKILEQTGVDIEQTKPAVREALFSTAVQHGASGAARIFNAAIDKMLAKPKDQAFEQALVKEVYDKRQHQFGSSTEAVRASVRGRLRQEKDMVLAMLDKNQMSKIV